MTKFMDKVKQRQEKHPQHRRKKARKRKLKNACEILGRLRVS